MSRKLRVLIADNSEDFVWLLVQYLSMASDIEIIGVAHDGRQAVQMVRQTQPDVLLLDIVMPGMDGIEVLRRIRVENEGIRVFIMSALAISHLVDAAGALGVEGYYVKPFDFRHMVQAIQEKKVASN